MVWFVHIDMGKEWIVKHIMRAWIKVSLVQID